MYRSDLEAAQARAEALEREAAEAKERAAAAEAEAEALREENARLAAREEARTAPVRAKRERDRRAKEEREMAARSRPAVELPENEAGEPRKKLRAKIGWGMIAVLMAIVVLMAVVGYVLT